MAESAEEALKDVPIAAAAATAAASLDSAPMSLGTRCALANPMLAVLGFPSSVVSAVRGCSGRLNGLRGGGGCCRVNIDDDALAADWGAGRNAGGGVVRTRYWSSVDSGLPTAVDGLSSGDVGVVGPALTVFLVDPGATVSLPRSSTQLLAHSLTQPRLKAHLAGSASPRVPLAPPSPHH